MEALFRFGARAPAGLRRSRASWRSSAPRQPAAIARPAQPSRTPSTPPPPLLPRLLVGAPLDAYQVRIRAQERDGAGTTVGEALRWWVRSTGRASFGYFAIRSTAASWHRMRTVRQPRCPKPLRWLRAALASAMRPRKSPMSSVQRGSMLATRCQGKRLARPRQFGAPVRRARGRSRLQPRRCRCSPEPWVACGAQRASRPRRRGVAAKVTEIPAGALASIDASESTKEFRISFDNDTDPDYTTVSVEGTDQTNLLITLTGAFASAGLTVASANILSEDGRVCDVFKVLKDGKKVRRFPPPPALDILPHPNTLSGGRWATFELVLHTQRAEILRRLWPHDMHARCWAAGLCGRSHLAHAGQQDSVTCRIIRAAIACVTGHKGC
eukprot:365445-Chlamydomonas_euryale.AAC.19